MTDRESIVADLRRMADDSQENRETFSPRALRELAERFERGDDMKPAKPKATIADLLALHDLDLGALAHVTGVIGDDIDDGDAMALCDKYQSVSDWHELVADVLPSIAAAFDARQFAALGAKVRAALSAPTIKVATPRVLQSAAEAPCGSLVKDRDDDITLRFTDGYGQHLGAKPRAYGAVIWSCKTMSPCIFKPITLIAEGLTEAECRHLSGLSAADALVWCEARDKACATHDAAVIDRLQRDGDSLRSLLAVIRHALGAGDHDDIVKHARAIKARADRA